MVPLGEVATIERNGVDPSSVPPSTSYLGLEHIERGGRIIGESSVGKAELKSTKFRFTPDHVLFGKLRPNLGKVARPVLDGVCSTDILPIRPGAHLDRDYLAHYLGQPSMVAFAASRATGANLPRLNPGVLAQFPVPLLSVAEQRRIAAILDHADALRAKRRQVLAHLDDLTQSVFHDMFGDPASNPHAFPLETLGGLSLKFGDGPFGSNLKSEHYRSQGVPVIRLQNIGVGKFLGSDRTFVSEAHYEGLKKHDCQPGDVLIATLGDPNLRACLQPASIPLALNKADCVQMRVIPDRAVPEWASALLNMPGTLVLANSLILGQTRSRISMGRLRELKVPVPPLGIQVQFANRIQTLVRVREQHQVLIERTDSLFASLQSRAFKGEL